jgi:DNA-binding response OmpR family regulator/chromosome segregation ATPase
MSTSQKKKILLVDDDPFLQCLYRKTLEHEGFVLLTADDGIAAIQTLPQHSPDLVVLDLMLPKMDGLKVLESIRTDSRYHDLPVLILSNAYLPQVAQKAMKAGATSGILKSECSPKQLVKIIHEILQAAAGKDTEQSETKTSWIHNFLGRKTEATQLEKPVEKQMGSDNPEISTSIETQKELQKSWPTDIAMMRGVCLKYAKVAGTQEAEDHLKEIYRRLRLLSARSTMAEWSQISELSSAVEAMLFERGFNANKRMPQSAVQTMFQAVDCLEYLLKTGRTVRAKATRRARILLVDDDPVCNCANEMALKRVNFETVCAGDGVSALALLQNSVFDLVLMDINMPVLSGLEACEKLRELPGCKEIPVIFVTMQDDFKSRAQSVLSGGNGLIAKPISPLELIVKTLIFQLHPQLPKTAKEPAAGSAPKSNQCSPSTAPDSVKPAAPPLAPLRLVESPSKPAPAPPSSVKDAPVLAAGQPTAPAPPERTHEEQAAACALLMGELEAALARLQREKEQLQKAAVAHPEKHADLVAALSQNHREQAILIKKIEAAWLQFEAQQRIQPVAQSLVPPVANRSADRPEVTERIKDLTEALSAETGRYQSMEQQAINLRQQITERDRRTKELESGRAAAEQKASELAHDLTAETKRGEMARQQVAAMHQQWKGIEAELAAAKQEQTRLQAELAEQQKSLDLQAGKAADQTKYLEASRAAAEKKAAELTEALAVAAKRCEYAEQEIAGTHLQKKALENELAASKTMQAELNSQLCEQQKLLDLQAKQAVDQTKELEASRAVAEKKAAELAVALAVAASRCENAEQEIAGTRLQREALENELAASKTTQAKLRSQLSEQQKSLDVQAAKMADQAKDFEANRAAAEKKTAELAEALAVAAKRCESAEQEIAGAQLQRKALENELAASKTTQAELQRQLNEQQKSLELQTNKVADQAKDFEANRAAAEKKTAELAEALAVAAKRCESAEQEIAGTQLQRKALENELAASKTTQAELQRQLNEQQKLLEAQAAQFAGQTRELEAISAATQKKVGELAKALAAETSRSENAEKNSAALARQKSALESELAASNKAQAQLQDELAEQRQSLDAEVIKLTAQTAELKAGRALVDEQIRKFSEDLATEKKRCQAVRQQAVNLGTERSALEQELAASNQAQTDLRSQLAEQKQSLETQTHILEVNLSSLKDLEASQAALEQKIGALTQALAAETQRSETAEQQVADIRRERNTLTEQLTASDRAQADLNSQLAEQQQLVELTTAELEGFRRCASAEAARQEQMAKQMAETEKAKIDLEQQLVANRSLLAIREEANRAAEAELEQRRKEQEQLDRSFQEETARRRRTEAEVKNVQAQLNEKNRHLAQKCAEEQAALQRSAALQSLADKQQESLAQSEAKVANLKIELQQGYQQIKELESRHSALRAEVQELTTEGKASAKVIQELQAKTARLENEIESGRREHAGLRYAILDASRMGAKLNGARLQQERQKFEGMRQLAALLAQTPLSLAQRGLLADLQNSMDGQKNQHRNGQQFPAYPIEMPGFRSSEFSLDEVTESACGPVRAAAEAAGVTVRVSTGPAPAKIKGSAEHIHQLITLLTVSPLATSTNITAIDLRATLKIKGEAFGEINLRIALSSKENAQDLLDHLAQATTAAPSLQAAALNEAEFGLAAAWQLATALGARAGVELQNGQEVCLLLSVPVELNPDLNAYREEPPAQIGAQSNPRDEVLVESHH